MTRPTLLLLPGLLCDSTVWAHQVQALSQQATCLIPDFATIGSIRAMAETAMAMAPDGPVLVAGHSMGGRVALEIARLFPERVSQLALLDTGTDSIAAGDSGDKERARRMELLQMARHQGMRRMGEVWAGGMVHPMRVNTPLFDNILAMIERQTPERFEAQQMALLGRPDARAVYAGLRCPTLLVCGRQDGWSPLARHEEMHRMLPHSHLEVIEESGHMTTMEQPEAVSAALLQWLERGASA